jgi:hypothetical protein
MQQPARDAGLAGHALERRARRTVLGDHAAHGLHDALGAV